jgi:signal peptidase I
MQNARHSHSVFPFGNLARFRRAAVTFAVILLGLGSQAHAGIKSPRQLAAIMKQTPAPHLVAEGQQLKEAEKMAAQIKDAITLWGVGQSMEPLYAPNTAVVVAPIKYDNVKKGMTIVYVKRNGRRVAHSVIGETRDGYLVQGVNNDEADAEAVNESNLIGVVVQAYASSETNFRSNLVQQVAAKDRNSSSDKNNT